MTAEAVAEGWAAASEMQLLLEEQQLRNRMLEDALDEAQYQQRRVLWQYGTRVALFTGVREGPDAPPSYAYLSKQVRRMQKQLMSAGKHELVEAEAQTELLGADLAVDQNLPEDGKKKKKSTEAVVNAAFSRFLPSGKPKGDIKRITLRALHKLISELYDALVAEAEDDEEGTGDFMESLHDFLLKRYGLKTLATKELYSIADALKRFKACEPGDAASRRILLFARFLGLSTELCDPPEELKLYLRLWRRASATVGAFLPENESGVCQFNMQYLNAVLLDDKDLAQEIQGKKMIALKLAMRTAGREEKCNNELKRIVKANTVLVADFDNLMDKVIRARYDNSEFELLFKAGDENGDGVLEVSEFKGIIAAVDPHMKQKEVLAMYKETLKLSGGEEDAISPAAFAWVAKRYGLDVSPQNICALLRTTWNAFRDSSLPEAVRANANTCSVLIARVRALDRARLRRPSRAAQPSAATTSGTPLWSSRAAVPFCLAPLPSLFSPSSPRQQLMQLTDVKENADLKKLEVEVEGALAEVEEARARPGTESAAGEAESPACHERQLQGFVSLLCVAAAVREAHSPPLFAFCSCAPAEG